MFPSLCVCVAPPRPHFREDAGMCKINRQQMPRSRPAGPSARPCSPCAASLRILETGAKMRPRCALSRDFSTSARAVDVRRPSGPRASRSATGFGAGQLTPVGRHRIFSGADRPRSGLGHRAPALWRCHWSVGCRQCRVGCQRVSHARAGRRAKHTLHTVHTVNSYSCAIL
jgi:hypothetical protein